jgi:hypothetical protein
MLVVMTHRSHRSGQSARVYRRRCDAYAYLVSVVASRPTEPAALREGPRNIIERENRSLELRDHTHMSRRV